MISFRSGRAASTSDRQLGPCALSWPSLLLPLHVPNTWSSRPRACVMYHRRYYVSVILNSDEYNKAVRHSDVRGFGLTRFRKSRVHCSVMIDIFLAARFSFGNPGYSTVA